MTTTIPIDGLTEGATYSITNMYGVEYRGTFCRLELCRSKDGGTLLVVVKKRRSHSFWRVPARHIRRIEKA